jgi:uncharacterized protein YneF (UPF0154 family)
VGPHIFIARQRMSSVLWSDPRLYNEKTTVIGSTVGSQNSSHEVPSRKKMTVFQIVIRELL